MKIIPLVVAWLGVVALANSATAAEGSGVATASPVTSPYAVLESFVGGAWVAPLPVEKDQPPRRIELHFAWNENKQGVHFDSAWFTGDKRAPYTSGMYAWNAAKKALVMFYTDSSGALTEGLVAQEGNVLAHELTLTNKNGSIENIRVRLTKLGNDAFTSEIFTQKDGGWTKFVEVRYERRG